MKKKMFFPYLIIILFLTLLSPAAGFSSSDLSTNGTNAFLPLIMNKFDEAQVTAPTIATHPGSKPSTRTRRPPFPSWPPGRPRCAISGSDRTIREPVGRT